jgi:hypothetical protein
MPYSRTYSVPLLLKRQCVNATEPYDKGVAYVNGFELGRYWLKPGGCHGDCAPPIKNGSCSGLGVGPAPPPPPPPQRYGASQFRARDRYFL